MIIFRNTLIAVAILLFLTMVSATIAMAQQAKIVHLGSDGKLVYTLDARGNTIPDFSYVGYKHSEEEIPLLSVVKTIVADTGDNLAKIQDAINEVGARTPDANGFRGAILLKAGLYKVSNSINLNKSGVVLRGEGNGTHILATRREQHNVINLKGSGGPSYNSATRKKITDSYVAIGARTVTVEAGHSFNVGDRIILERKPNQAWISLLGMDKLRSDKTQWTPEAYTFLFKRVVVAINGNSITIDAPVVDPIDPKYAEGFLYKYTWTNKIENSGIENMLLDSEYSSAEDEQHAWNGVQINNAENCWVQNVEGHHFGYSTTDMDGHAYKISVINCKYLDPISVPDGGRRYSFNIGGQQCMVKGCYAKSGRHDFVLDARTPGPNVFLNCKTENQKDDSGPHQRWAVGCLYDNISGPKELNVMNRSNSGSGHGWAGSQMLFWNCKFAKHTLQDPPADHINWAIGCTAATITGNGRYETEPLGYVESKGTNVLPQSLFEQQLKDRLNKTTNVAPTVSITSPANNATFTAPASIAINANAADSDGSVAKVDFYNGSSLLGSDNTSPYGFAWNNVAAGTYSITAKATDDKGAVTTSAVVTIDVTCTPTPIVAYIQVDGGTWQASNTATVNVGSSISFGPQPKTGGSWNWSGPNAFSNSAREVTISNIQGSQAGSYIASYTNSAGCKSTETFTIIVNKLNSTPTVNITSPSNNAEYTAPASITINVNASDSDGSITKVEFYNGTTLLGSDNSSPYSFTWSNVSTGTYTITAKASDNSGSVTTTAAISVKVNPANGGGSPCTGVSNYVENGGYVAGSKVQNAGGVYQCKPYPYSGWCNGAAWAYGPGTGTYWSDAWDKVATCTPRLTSSTDVNSESMITIVPNPTSQSTIVKLNMGDINSADYIIINPLGVEVLKGAMDSSLEKSIDLTGVQNGIYTIRINAGSNAFFNKIIKQ